MDASTDVLVVGAGPAGSLAALMLARAGVKVRLIDRSTFPRDKLCGDTVNPGSLSLLYGVGLGAIIRASALRVTGMTVTGPNNASVSVDYPEGVTGAALTRRVFDQHLVDAAVSAGALFDDGVSVRSPIVDGGHVHGVTVRCGAAEVRVTARMVIAADGRGSRLGSALGLSAFASRPRRWAFGAYFEGVDGLTDRGEMHVRHYGYVGVAPLPGGIANVCVVREIHRRDSASGLPQGLESRPYDDVHVLDSAVGGDMVLRGRFASARRISNVSVLGPLAVDARASGCSGLLLAGDAAGFVDPMTGDGLRFALRGGMLAAEYALRELDSGRPQYRALHVARRQEFSTKWRVNRALRALVASPRGVSLAAAVARHWDAPIRKVVALAGDVGLARDGTIA